MITISIDTREAHRWPYEFPCPVVVGNLDAGDYSIPEFETGILIKRLTPEALFRSCGVDREEFVVELENLARVPSPHLVLETTLDAIRTDPPIGSRMSPKAVESSLIAWAMRYGLHLWPCGSRESAERCTWLILERWWKDRCEGTAWIDRRERKRAAAFMAPLREASQAAAQQQAAMPVPRVVVV